MMLNAYYRENNYSPLYALNGSISLLLEIPFFIAAYHFLSHLEVLRGASFSLIKDLGGPDGLLVFGTGGGIKLNFLPILMTSINCVSSAIYLKGFPIKDKIQTYGMALIFLVLLYNSLSGLVVYWTCNNIFSLGKNVFYKLKNPRKKLAIFCAALGFIVCIAIILSGALNSKKKILFVFLLENLSLVYFCSETIKMSEGAESFLTCYSVLSQLSAITDAVFTSSNEFMTNADTPTIAFKDIVENPVNPFTGKKINSDEKTAHPQIVTNSSSGSVKHNNGYTYKLGLGKVFSVHDDIFNPDNWKLISQPNREEKK